jgi:hypothetical protein
VEREKFRNRVEKLTIAKWKRENGGKLRPHQKFNSYRSENPLISINEAISILQRVYTRTFNKRYSNSGSLFRAKCKAKLNFDYSRHVFDDPIVFALFSDEDLKSYATHCMRYIHQNPVHAGLVEKASDWEFSSEREYLGMIPSEDCFCNLEIGKRIRSLGDGDLDLLAWTSSDD